MLKLQEKTIIEPIANDVDKSEIDLSMFKAACKTSTNNIIQLAWNLINELNSLIATIDFDYKESNKDDIKKILNTIIDDTTIDIGMLYKVISLFDGDVQELISDGESKAEEIIEDENEEIDSTNSENIENNSEEDLSSQA